MRLSSCATSFRICRVIIGVMSFMSPAGLRSRANRTRGASLQRALTDQVHRVLTHALDGLRALLLRGHQLGVLRQYEHELHGMILLLG